MHHTKVLSGTKKERNQWVFFVVKGILRQKYYESSIGRTLLRRSIGCEWIWFYPLIMAAIASSTSVAAPCHGCLHSACACGTTKVLPAALPPAALSLVRLASCAQIEVVVDSEVSLLLPRARVDAARITEHQRLQGMWRQKRLQKQRWIQLVMLVGTRGGRRTDYDRLIATD